MDMIHMETTTRLITETKLPEQLFIETVQRDQYEASQLLNDAFKTIEINDLIVRTMTVSQKVMQLLPSVTMKSGERILDKTPYGLKFWTASIIVNDVKDIILSSEENRDGLILSDTAIVINNRIEQLKLSKENKNEK
jgi:hypothetical protein